MIHVEQGTRDLFLRVPINNRARRFYSAKRVSYSCTRLAIKIAPLGELPLPKDSLGLGNV